MLCVRSELQRATPRAGAGYAAQHGPGAGVPVDGGHAVHQPLPRRRVDANQVAPLHIMCQVFSALVQSPLQLFRLYKT